MIFDDEHILVDSIQKDIDNDLNLIKIVTEQYGTFDHNETRRILNHMFSEILNDETLLYLNLQYLIKSYGWFISDIDKFSVTITENPKILGRSGKLFEILVVGTPGGLMYCVKFHERTSELAKYIKSYMIEKYKLVPSDMGPYWILDSMKRNWFYC